MKVDIVNACVFYANYCYIYGNTIEIINFLFNLNVANNYENTKGFL